MGKVGGTKQCFISKKLLFFKVFKFNKPGWVIMRKITKNIKQNNKDIK